VLPRRTAARETFRRYAAVENIPSNLLLPLDARISTGNWPREGFRSFKFGVPAEEHGANQTQSLQISKDSEHTGRAFALSAITSVWLQQTPLACVDYNLAPPPPPLIYPSTHSNLNLQYQLLSHSRPSRQTACYDDLAAAGRAAAAACLVPKRLAEWQSDCTEKC
jgi:hypothetical protein